LPAWAFIVNMVSVVGVAVKVRLGAWRFPISGPIH
jgi:hypothetical protein